MQEDFLDQCCKEIIKLHDADHQSKAVWSTIYLVTGNSISKGIIIAERDAERNQLWYNHFNNLLSPPTSAESNTGNEDLSRGIDQAFNNQNYRADIIDKDELVLAVKSLSSDK
jgi:hypothetical protein